VRSDGAGHAIVGVDGEFGVELGPRPARHIRRDAADEIGEFFRIEEEAARGVHLPDEPQGMATSFGTRLRFGRGRLDGRRLGGRWFDGRRFDGCRLDGSWLGKR